MVDHLDQAILLSHHFIPLALDLDVRIRIWDLVLIFFETELLWLPLVLKTYSNLLEDDVIQYLLVDEADFT